MLRTEIDRQRRILYLLGKGLWSKGAEPSKMDEARDGSMNKIVNMQDTPSE